MSDIIVHEPLVKDIRSFSGPDVGGARRIRLVKAHVANAPMLSVGYHNAAKWSKRGLQAGSFDSCCEMFAISRDQGQASVITSREGVYNQKRLHQYLESKGTPNRV